MRDLNKELVYVDMDDTLCSFYRAAKKALTENPSQPYPQSQWGFFLGLEPLEGAIEGFRKLEERYDVWILTRPSTKNLNCYTEKAKWIFDHFGQDIVDKLILCPEKALLKGKGRIKTDQFIFPILNQSDDLQNPITLLNKISASTALINKDLKVISKRAKINKNISFQPTKFFMIHPNRLSTLINNNFFKFCISKNQIQFS
jgi:hypothetical protein